jgi:3-oxoadipate enol-lactonase
MPVVQANGLDINYRIDGSGPETVLLINGVGDELEGWAFQREEFAAAGFQVVTFDNRGSGSSGHPPGPYRSQQMAVDTKGLVDALQIAPLHLVGVSMGGVIAQEYAAAYPGDLRSVVLANTYAAPDPFTYAAFESWALIAQMAGMPVMMRQQAPWVFSSYFYESQPEKLVEFLTDMDQTTQPASSFAAQIAVLLTHDATDLLGSIETPALVIASADDIIIKPALSYILFEALPRATWEMIPGGHATFLEDPAIWNQTVLEFINRHRLDKRRSSAEAEAPAEEARAETEAPAEQARAETEAPAEQARAETEAPAEQARAETEAPAEEPHAETEAPAKESRAGTEAEEARAEEGLIEQRAEVPTEQ